ncbi:hypothetical protein NQ318_008171 [Aromia moschata]|uniref:Mos1 transposase HTH domain-containing protein n=1 Tax=Aromia moschata TaxID=1265417 RepID=A0AAV8YKQ6_9CUCU|nr:hypothetical protein NQ318_008171 [Aromia moschata]
MLFRGSLEERLRDKGEKLTCKLLELRTMLFPDPNPLHSVNTPEDSKCQINYTPVKIREIDADATVPLRKSENYPHSSSVSIRIRRVQDQQQKRIASPHNYISRVNVPDKQGAFQERFGVNVRMGVIGTRIVGPIFFENPLTADQYLQFLSNEIAGFLENLPINEYFHIYYQQDGTPAHNARRYIYRNLVVAYGANNALSLATCKRWFARFRSDDYSINNIPLSGRPPQLDIEHLRTIVEANPYGTTRELSCRQATVVRGLEMPGKVQKLGKWIPRLLKRSRGTFAHNFFPAVVVLNGLTILLPVWSSACVEKCVITNEKVQIIKWYFGGGSVRDIKAIFNEKFPNRRVRERCRSLNLTYADATNMNMVSPLRVLIGKSF